MTRIVKADERTLPHNLEAERAVLGAILVHNDSLDAAMESVKEGDFYREAHKTIFSVMVGLHDRHIGVDFVTIREDLTRLGVLDDIGGPSYITSLADGVPRSVNVKHYARIVADLSVRREVIYATNKVHSEAHGGERNGVELVRYADGLFLAIDTQRYGSDLVAPEESVCEGTRQEPRKTRCDERCVDRRGYRAHHAK